MNRRTFLQTSGASIAGTLVTAVVRPPSVEAQLVSAPMWMDCQNWWQAAADPVPSHFHLSATWPLRQQVSGTFTLDLHLEAFNQPSGAMWTEFKLLIDQPMVYPRTTITPSGFPWDIGVEPGGHITRDIQLAIPTIHPNATKRLDGWTLLKVFGEVLLPDGTGLIAVTRLPIYVKNGFPVGATAGKPWSGAAGWAHDPQFGSHQYPTALLYAESEAAMRSGVPAVWKPVVGVQSSHTPLSRMRVCVDPKFHDLSDPDFPEGNPGLVVYDGPPVSKKVLSIDTTGLASGVHRLFIQAIETAFASGSSAGVAVYQFVVP